MKKYFYFKLVTFVAFIIILLDKITQIFFKKKNLKNFLPKIHDIIEKKQYYSVKINNKNLIISHIGTIAPKTDKYWIRFLDLMELSKFDIELNIYGNNNVSFFNNITKIL